jgi:phenylalanyl-tRNA synthetase beta chain
VERALDPSILVIADAAGPVALAGVMGGEASAVKAGTTDILLESATFDPARVRSGRRRLGLSTDASYRFERQADIEAAGEAADRATALFVELAGGSVREATADVRPRAAVSRQISLRVQRCNDLIGCRLSAPEVAGLLERLELPATAAGERVVVTVPSFRRDLVEEIDLVEEVARVHGYERIAADSLPPAPLLYAANPHDELLGRLRALAVGLGYQEVRTSAFMDSRDPDRLQLPEQDERRRAVHLTNPIVVQLDTMRTSLLPGMLRVLRHNRNFDQEMLRFVQVDRVFLDRPGPYPGLPAEPEWLVLLASGASQPPGWGNPARAVDLYDLKGDVETLLGTLGVDTRWVYGYTGSLYEDGVSFEIHGSYGIIGRGGAVRERVLRGFDLEPPVFAFEMDVEVLAGHLPGTRQARELSRFPAAKRDLSVRVPAGVPYADIQAAVLAPSCSPLHPCLPAPAARSGR